jgi:hypothetical protein
VALYDPGEERELILNQNKGRAGVYRWINKVSGNTYIVVKTWV